MRSKVEVAILILASAALVGVGAPAKPNQPGIKVYTVLLSGQAEVNETTSGWGGDMDGSGSVRLTIDPRGKRICYDFTLARLETPLMAHIHRAHAQHIGPTVVTLFTGPGGDLHNCRMWTEERLAEIVSDPSNFYVNLYTTEYPDGALRGQLKS